MSNTVAFEDCDPWIRPISIDFDRDGSRAERVASIERILHNSASMRQAKEEVRAALLKASEEHRSRHGATPSSSSSSSSSSFSAPPARHADSALRSALLSDQALEGRILQKLSDIGADKALRNAVFKLHDRGMQTRPRPAPAFSTGRQSGHPQHRHPMYHPAVPASVLNTPSPALPFSLSSLAAFAASSSSSASSSSASSSSSSSSSSNPSSSSTRPVPSLLAASPPLLSSPSSSRASHAESTDVLHRLAASFVEAQGSGGAWGLPQQGAGHGPSSSSPNKNGSAAASASNRSNTFKGGKSGAQGMAQGGLLDSHPPLPAPLHAQTLPSSSPPSAAAAVAAPVVGPASCVEDPPDPMRQMESARRVWEASINDELLAIARERQQPLIRLRQPSQPSTPPQKSPRSSSQGSSEGSGSGGAGNAGAGGGAVDDATAAEAIAAATAALAAVKAGANPSAAAAAAAAIAGADAGSGGGVSGGAPLRFLYDSDDLLEALASVHAPFAGGANSVAPAGLTSGSGNSSSGSSFGGGGGRGVKRFGEGCGCSGGGLSSASASSSTSSASALSSASASAAAGLSESVSGVNLHFGHDILDSELWGLAKACLDTPDMAALRKRFAALSPDAWQMGVDDHPLLGTSATQQPLPPTPLAKAAALAHEQWKALAAMQQQQGSGAGAAAVASALSAASKAKAKALEAESCGNAWMAISTDPTELEDACELFQGRQARLGRRVVEEGFIPAAKAYAQAGVPPGMRARVWRVLLGLPAGPSPGQKVWNNAALPNSGTATTATSTISTVDAFSSSSEHTSNQQQQQQQQQQQGGRPESGNKKGLGLSVNSSGSSSNSGYTGSSKDAAAAVAAAAAATAAGGVSSSSSLLPVSAWVGLEAARLSVLSEQLWLDKLLKHASAVELVTDALFDMDVDHLVDSDHFFPFEDRIRACLTAFSRDHTVRSNSLVRAHTPCWPAGAPLVATTLRELPSSSPQSPIPTSSSSSSSLSSGSRRNGGSSSSSSGSKLSSPSSSSSSSSSSDGGKGSVGSLLTFSSVTAMAGREAMAACGVPPFACVPICGVMPFKGFANYCAPLAFLFADDAPMYHVFRAMWQRYWCRLNVLRSRSSCSSPDRLDHHGACSSSTNRDGGSSSSSSGSSGVFGPGQGAPLAGDGDHARCGVRRDGDCLPVLCQTFEELVQAHDPNLFFHMLELKLPPLRVAMPWIHFAFVTLLHPGEVLVLWDRVLGFDDLMLLPVLAAAVLLYRSRLAMECETAEELKEVFRDGGELKVAPLLQHFLFPTPTERPPAPLPPPPPVAATATQHPFAAAPSSAAAASGGGVNGDVP